LRRITLTALTSSVGVMAVVAVGSIYEVFISMRGNAELAAAAGDAGAILQFTTSFGFGMARMGTIWDTREPSAGSPS
tara:strand:- start:5502 stop:5732 length:231 start_codon:yes stop_codon:yes gene_type:complete